MSQMETNDDDNKTISDSLSVFCREVRNLLRSKANCMIPFSKFVPAYHNHYGRQCCVYQFGYTKLIELLESIPHVVQIIGDGTNRYITLTHREQIKRFASDLIKVVKSQPGKKLKLSQFSRAYEQVLGRTFRVEDYGTNNINVLLAEIWEGTINIIPIKRESLDIADIKQPLFVDTTYENAIIGQLIASTEPVNKPYITEQYPDAWFEIPKRERSEKEVKRTKYFIWDVIELLSSMEPDHAVPFSKFIPSYHYYFNRQCKVSIFGFSKLIDLFESISPEVVEIIDQGPGEEKLIKLASRQLSPYRNRTQSRHYSNSNSKGIYGNNNAYNNQQKLNCRRNNSSDSYSPAKLSYNGEPTDGSSSSSSSGALSDISGNRVQDELDDGDDILVPIQPIDSGPTEEELMELEDELEAYEVMKAIQSKRSSRMAAILDIFKYSIY